MTTFSYPPAMAHHDFELFATSQEQFTDFPPSTAPTYMGTSASFDIPFADALSSIDSFASIPAYSTQPQSQEQFRYVHDAAPHAMKDVQHAYSPTGSPSHSSNFEMPPPHLSTSSESGASVQSTSSSAIGSPSMHPQLHEQQMWNSQVNGLGFAPGIVQHDHFGAEPFSTSYEQEPIIANDKLSGFVGESFAVQSSSVAISGVHASAFPSSSVSSSNLQADEPSTTRSPTLSPTCKMDPQLLRSTQRTPTLPSQRLESTFKSPFAPASARSVSRASPPFQPHGEQRRRSSAGVESKPRRNSLLSQQIWPPVTPPQEPQELVSRSPQSFQSPFFLQSNNNFVAPLQSSYPNLINSFPSPLPMQSSAYPEITTTSPRIPFYEHPPSPAPSTNSQTHQDSRRFRPAGSQSPYLQTHQWAPYPQYPGSRRPSVSSTHSKHSQRSNRSASGSFDLDDEGREKGLCPIPECGRVFKDLKAHMLTHLLERPEKCPIATCEYHVKGFARKYDKNRHTLTHYKGTMVCGFCPGSGSAAEKSFNRADVFKRHLTSVHGVEQTAPNSRKRSPSGSKKASSGAAQSTTAGTCSTCSVTFANAQEFYEHLDDCVLRVVQQTDPSEAINQKHLSSVADDKKVQDTLDKHHLPSTVDYTAPEYNEQDDEEDEEEFDNDDANDHSYGSNSRAGKGTIKNKKC